MSAHYHWKARMVKRIFIAVWSLLGVSIIVWLRSQNFRSPEELLNLVPREKFAGFNNETGTADGRLIIPNIVHFIVFKDPQISFSHFICVLAALKNQNPDQIFFHTNVAQFEGIYWKRLLRLKKFRRVYAMRGIDLPESISGKEIQSGWRVFHGSDITRIRVMMEFGGIYLDNDSYIVKSLDPFRKFEIAIGWDDNEALGSQIIVAHKDARFLKIWLKTYDGQYDPKKWYYNIGELPTSTVLEKHPELVHRVKLLFGNKLNFIYKLFEGYWDGWRNNYAFHLLIRHQYLLKNISSEATYPVIFDEHNLQKYPITFREMANELLTYEQISPKFKSLAGVG